MHPNKFDLMQTCVLLPLLKRADTENVTERERERERKIERKREREREKKRK